MTPIPNRTRFIITTTLFILFLIGAPILVFYSTGYRLGESFAIVKTGGIFIHSDVSETRVYLNDEFVENNGVILRNTLIQDLTPNKIYKVKVEKDEHNVWEKELYVQPNLVTESAILMLPYDIPQEEILPLIDADSGVPTSTKNVANLANPEYEGIIDLFDSSLEQFEVELSTTTPAIKSLDKNSLTGRILRSTTTIGSNLITVFYASTTFPDFIENLGIDNIFEKKSLKEKGKILAWLEDGDVKVRWAGDKESIPYYFCIKTCTEEITVSLDTPIQKYDFFPGRDDVLIVKTYEDIFAIEIDHRSKPNLQPIYQGNDIDFIVRDNNTVFVKEGIRVYRLDI